VSAAPNTFAGATLDRAAQHRTDERWVAERLADPAARAVVVGEEGPWVREQEGEIMPALTPVAATDGVVFLGLDDAGPLFAAPEPAPPDARAISLREAGARLRTPDAGLVAYAAGILNWHRSHPHCSRCGTKTRIAEAGFLRVCPSCGAEHHPRTDPVVIMLVADGDRVLLGRGPTWGERNYSALAGFVEPGESLEEAVARELREEAGVEIAVATYSSSQPWPFPSSLMLGFHASYAGGEPHVRDRELEDVRWFTRDEVAAAFRGEEGPLHIPPPIAIARRLIEEWLDER
jgi:NAD+ diphosphatase